jgi:hypothetical protein
VRAVQILEHWVGLARAEGSAQDLLDLGRAHFALTFASSIEVRYNRLSALLIRRLNPETNGTSESRDGAQGDR